jgi:hypothetical protein
LDQRINAKDPMSSPSSFLDELGKIFLKNLEDAGVDLGKKAEIANPAINMPYYQEEVGQGSESLLEYSDMGDSSQNSGFYPKKNDGQEWKPMTQQGERPDNDADFYRDPYASSGLLIPEGETESRPKNQGGGYFQDKEIVPTDTLRKDDVDVPTHGAGLPPVEDYGSEIPYDQAIYLAAGEQEMSIDWEEKLKSLMERRGETPDMFENMLSKQRCNKSEDSAVESDSMDSMYKGLMVGMPAGMSKAAALAEEAILRGSTTSGEKIVLASLDDLFSFNRVATNTLIHKSSEDLWKIGVDASGQTFIEQLYNDNGEPLKG